jgi:shikimate kinase
MSGPAAILIGPPGAGKSTIGPVLAARLGLTFLDTDAGIEAEAGKPVSDIFVEDGEDAFRVLERTAVARAVAEHPGVLGLGGGAVLDAGTQELLVYQPVVYLRPASPPRSSGSGWTPPGRCCWATRARSARPCWSSGSRCTSGWPG